MVCLEVPEHRVEEDRVRKVRIRLSASWLGLITSPHIFVCNVLMAGAAHLLQNSEQCVKTWERACVTLPELLARFSAARPCCSRMWSCEVQVGQELAASVLLEWRSSQAFGNLVGLSTSQAGSKVTRASPHLSTAKNNNLGSSSHQAESCKQQTTTSMASSHRSNASPADAETQVLSELCSKSNCPCARSVWRGVRLLCQIFFLNQGAHARVSSTEPLRTSRPPRMHDPPEHPRALLKGSPAETPPMSGPSKQKIATSKAESETRRRMNGKPRHGSGFLMLWLSGHDMFTSRVSLIFLFH